MRIILYTIILASFSFFSLAENLALPCYGCHSKQNNSSNKTIPSIEGLSEKYIINAFIEYKNKIRDNYLMQIVSNGYSDKEIKALAVFFSNKKTKND